MSQVEPRPRGLYRLLRDQAEAHPYRIYRHSPLGPVTYRRMSEIASCVAGRLRQDGRVSRRAILAVRVDHSEHLLRLIWGGLESGTCLALLPPTKELEQVRLLMRAVGAEALATDVPELAAAEEAIPLEALTAGPSRTDRAPAAAGPAIAPDTPAFLFGTSGSTGEPKWVRLTHGQYLTALEAATPPDDLPHGEGQVVYLTPMLFHAYGLNRLLVCALHGSAIALPAGASPLGAVGDLMGSWLSGLVTDVEGVPDFFAQMARIAPRLRLPNLRHISLAGGLVNPEVVDRIVAACPGLCYTVTYGLTEAPPFVSQKLYRPPYAGDRKSAGPVSPVYGVQIVDEAGDPVRPGIEGEIHVRGDCLALPYLGESGPFVGWFASGDVGYLNADGELCVVSRKSYFLKVRGFRISPERIESVLSSMEGVADCRVSMKGEDLLAEVVRGHPGLTVDAVLDHVAARLPAYCVPRFVEYVDSVPRTPTGKVRRG